MIAGWILHSVYQGFCAIGLLAALFFTAVIYLSIKDRGRNSE